MTDVPFRAGERQQPSDRELLEALGTRWIDYAERHEVGRTAMKVLSDGDELTDDQLISMAGDSVHNPALYAGKRGVRVKAD